ncbi:acetylcholine receptor subunit beta-like [Pecten maximus]|uniref:acetylcholine receptor subunit beta-like n=1 Tax=Pecten maximus TaxID=6579 RepID=UPI0014586A6F|nr:acetylcholine receptor subunit beta-like [Pecten maximus]
MYSSISGVQTSTRLDTQVLHDKLLQTYNKDLGPNFNQSQPILLQLSFNLFTLNEFDDIAGKLVFLGLSNIEWRDDRMVWNPLEHGNTTTVMMPQSKVWIPHLFVAKPHTNVKKIGYDFVQVTYTSDGWARWAVPDLFDISCTADIAYFPMDRQKCEIYISPWSYEESTFDFRLPLNTMTQTDFVENGAWKILSTELYVAQHIDNEYVVMVINFQRRPLFIILNLLLPILVVEVLNVFVFLLPPDPGERSAFGVTVLLSMAVFLSIVSDKLPSTSDPHIARVSIYIAAELTLSALIMLFAMISLLLYNKPDDQPIPGWIRRLVSKRSKQQKHKQRDPRVHRHMDNPEVDVRRGVKRSNQGNGRYKHGIDSIEIYRGYHVEQLRLGEHQCSYTQDYRDPPYTSSEDLCEGSTDVEDTPIVTWNDVAKVVRQILFGFIFILKYSYHCSERNRHS